MENANFMTMLKWHFESLESLFFLSITSSNDIPIVFSTVKQSWKKF